MQLRIRAAGNHVPDGRQRGIGAAAVRRTGQADPGAPAAGHDATCEFAVVDECVVISGETTDCLQRCSFDENTATGGYGCALVRAVAEAERVQQAEEI